MIEDKNKARSNVNAENAYQIKYENIKRVNDL